MPRRSPRILLLLVLPAILFSCPRPVPTEGVFHVYLTWLSSDTSTALTINYHTPVVAAPVSQVFYDTVPRGGNPNDYAFAASGAAHQIPGLAQERGADRLIHVVEVTNLEPGGTYYFIAGDVQTGFSEERKFRTLPSDGDIRLVTGGDIGIDPVVDDLFAAAAARSPDVALLGGDLAYVNGDLGEWRDWDTFLEKWGRNMITPDGYTIPMILAIGNHELTNGFFQFFRPLQVAPFYFGLFAQEGAGFSNDRRSFFARDLGPRTRLFVLDTNHVTPALGAQRDWLATEMAALAPDTLSFALYHVPLYPSHRAFGPISMSALIRDAWLPVFDLHGLDLAFENHDHMHKRTIPLTANAPADNGAVYLGDGAFGRSPRTGDQAQALDDPANLEALGLTADYLAAWSSRRHFWLVDVPANPIDPVTFQAVDANGAVFDSGALPAPAIR